MLSYRYLFMLLLKKFVLIVIAALAFVLVIIWMLNIQPDRDAVKEPMKPKNDISKPALYVSSPANRTFFSIHFWPKPLPLKRVATETCSWMPRK